MIISEHKTLRLSLKLSLLIVGVISMLALTPHASAAPSVAITSPSAGTKLPIGQPVTVSGTASANTTVLVKNGASVIGSTISNGAGAWSVVVNGLAPGTTTLTAEAIQNGPYAYFGTVGGSYQIHRLRLSDFALNPGGGGWPVTSSTLTFFPVRSDNAYNNLFFLDIGNQSTPAKFTVSAPADPVPTTGYPAATTPFSGDSNPAGTKLYIAAAESNAISVIDVASNTQIGSIAIGGVAQSIRRGPNGNMYATDTTNNAIKIIDPNSDTVIGSFAVSCPTNGSVGSVFYEAPNDYMLITCAQDGIIRKFRTSDNALLTSWNISSSLSSISAIMYSLDGKKLYVSGLVTTAGTNKIAIIDTSSGLVTSTIPLTAETFTASMSPDGQYLFAPTPGATFSTTNIDVISTQTNTVVANIDTSSFGLPGIVYPGLPGQTASTTVTFSLANVTQPTLADTGKPWTSIALVALAMSGVGLSLTYLARRKFLSS